MSNSTVKSMNCPNCGGPLDVAPEDFTILSTKGAFYHGKMPITGKCPHCESTLSIEPFSEVLPAPSNSATITNSPDARIIQSTLNIGEAKEGSINIGVSLTNFPF